MTLRGRKLAPGFWAGSTGVRKVGRRRVGAKRKAANRKLATVGQVKALLHKNVETKYMGLTYNAGFNNRISGTSDLIKIIPDISSGTGNNDRLGNKITPKGLKVVVSMTVNQVNGSTSIPMLPRLMVLSAKNVKAWTDIASVDVTKFLDDGVAERAFGGDITDYQCPLNKEYVIAHKDIKTELSLGTAEQNGQRTRTYTFWIKCPKVLNYNDFDVTPTNFAPFLCMGFAVGDFSVPSEAFLGVRLALTSMLYYEDA